MFFYVYYKYKLLLCRNMVVYAGVEEQPKLGRSREDLTEVSILFPPHVNTYPGSKTSYIWSLIYFKVSSYHPLPLDVFQYSTRFNTCKCLLSYSTTPTPSVRASRQDPFFLSKVTQVTTPLSTHLGTTFM